MLRSRGIRSDDLLGYLELRSRLKDHIHCKLLWHLVEGGHAGEEMREDQLYRDLGL